VPNTKYYFEGDPTMIISNLSHLEAAESTNIIGGSDFYQTFMQHNKIDVYQDAYSTSYAEAFRGDAVANSQAYNALKIDATNYLEA
jgi:dihydrofolate reductase